jgi:hypothetical protein
VLIGVPFGSAGSDIRRLSRRTLSRCGQRVDHAAATNLLEIQYLEKGHLNQVALSYLVRQKKQISVPL